MLQDMIHPLMHQSFSGAPTPDMECYSPTCSVCGVGHGQNVDGNYSAFASSLSPSMPLLDTYYSDVDMESYQHQHQFLQQQPPSACSSSSSSADHQTPVMSAETLMLPAPPLLPPSLSPPPLALEDYYCMQDPNAMMAAVGSCSFFPGGSSTGCTATIGISMNSTGMEEEIGDVPMIYPTDEYGAVVDDPQDMFSFTDKQCVGGGCGGSTSLPCSPLDESNFKVVRLSAEERREKINRYLKKRHERNFTKKIKYACRKTLADRRPRVRGRFAKNEENDQEQQQQEVLVIKEEDPYSELFGNLNSPKLNYSLESWMY